MIPAKNPAGPDRQYEQFRGFQETLKESVYPEPPTKGHEEITEAMLQMVLDHTHLPPTATVLDVGCGQGVALDRFAARGFHPVGVTLGEEDARQCRLKGHDVRIMDQSFLEFDDGTFDLIWIRHCLEHSIAPFLTLSGLYRVARDHGWAYIEVPAPDTVAHHERNENHFSILPLSSWTALIERTGFAVRQQKRISLKLTMGEDVYWAFLCQKEPRPAARVSGPSGAPLYLGLSAGDNFGWGVCSKYLAQELARLVPIVPVERVDGPAPCREVPGKALTGIGSFDFDPIVPLKGTETFAYTFFEYNLQPEALARAQQYDRVFCGSTWCRDWLANAGVPATDVLIQGVDPRLFHPVLPRPVDDMFVIFSGGKFEYRKGQDLVLRAIKILQEKYRDIVLMNAWYNSWADSLAYMATSPHIHFRIGGTNWGEQMSLVYRENGLDERRILTLPMMKHESFLSIYAKTDLGVFPNRCEGGTNLVLMEYMACGKPVIASFASGHRDVVREENAILLKELTPLPIEHKGVRVADWLEPSLDEMVAAIEYAYHHRDELRVLGGRAGEDMKRFTWQATARRALSLMGMQ